MRLIKLKHLKEKIHFMDWEIDRWFYCLQTLVLEFQMHCSKWQCVLLTYHFQNIVSIDWLVVTVIWRYRTINGNINWMKQIKIELKIEFLLLKFFLITKTFRLLLNNMPEIKRRNGNKVVESVRLDKNNKTKHLSKPIFLIQCSNSVGVNIHEWLLFCYSQII